MEGGGRAGISFFLLILPFHSDFVYLVVLISSHRDEVGLGEHVRPKSAVGQLKDVVGPHDVKARLIFMHGVQDGLSNTQTESPEKCQHAALVIHP